MSTRLERAHRRARGRGVSRPLYALVRVIVTPVLRLWCRLHVTGRQHVPKDGAAILAPNHKSFLDPFFIAVGARRHVRYMAKTELFRGPLAGLLPRLGAFPVRRGEADAEAIATAKAILAQGGIVVVFPEGTRVDDAHELGSPHHGAGRLALETGAPIVPTAITGTDHLWFGPILRPRRVQLTFVAPLDPANVAGRPDATTELVDRELWPTVQAEYERQLAKPGLILAALTALGIGGGLLARRQARATSRLVGFVEPRKVRRLRRKRKARLHLPGR